MRQEYSGSIGAAIAADLAKLMRQDGDATLLNGVATTATWTRAQPGRIQQFVQPNEMAPPGYDVALPPEVLLAPFSLVVGMTMTWLADGQLQWSGEVRDIDPIRVNNVVIGYRALVLMVPV